MQSSATTIAKGSGKYHINNFLNPPIEKPPKKVAKYGAGTEAPLLRSIRVNSISIIGAMKIYSIIPNLSLLLNMTYFSPQL